MSRFLPTLIATLAVLSLFTSSLHAQFDDDSAQITHPWSGLYSPGESYSLSGTGTFNGGERTLTVSGTESVLGVNCLVFHQQVVIGGWQEDQSQWFAQDTSGNVRILKGTVSDSSGNYAEWTASSPSSAPIYMPANPYVGQVLTFPWGSEIEVLDLDAVVPEMQTGAGPYEHCVVLRDDNDGDIDFEYICPTVGLVQAEWNDGGLNGWAREPGRLEADFDLEYRHLAPLHAMQFEASHQDIAPSWWLRLDNASASNLPLDAVVFDAPYAFTETDPAPDDVNGTTYRWEDLMLAAGERHEIFAAQSTDVDSVYLPFTISRTLSGNEITGSGTITTVVTLVPQPGLESFRVGMAVAPALTEDDWNNGNYFGQVTHESFSCSDWSYVEFTHDDQPILQFYDWLYTDYTPGATYTFTTEVRVDLNADVSQALLEPFCWVGGHLDADYGTELWVDDTLTLPGGGSVELEGPNPLAAYNPHYWLSWYEVELPHFAQTEGPPCPGDLNGDNYVGQQDLGILLASYEIDGGGDVDGDGDTDQSDLGILLAHYETDCDDQQPQDMALIPAGEFRMGDHSGDGHSSELPVHDVYIDSFYMDVYETTNQRTPPISMTRTPAQVKVVGGIVYGNDSGNNYPYCDTYSYDDSRIHWDGSYVHRDGTGKETIPWRRSPGTGRSPTPTGAAARKAASRPTTSAPGPVTSAPMAIACPRRRSGSTPPAATSTRRTTSTPGATRSTARMPTTSTPAIPGRACLTRRPRPSATTTATRRPRRRHGQRLRALRHGGQRLGVVQRLVRRDYYDSSPYDNPRGPSSGTRRVLRGGSWSDHEGDLRCASRYGFQPYGRSDVGFRLALD
jgi:hypothetical protein